MKINNRFQFIKVLLLFTSFFFVFRGFSKAEVNGKDNFQSHRPNTNVISGSGQSIEQLQQSGHVTVQTSQTSELQNSTSPNPKLPEWTIIVYVQANNNLAKYAIRNFEEMSLVGSNDKLKILVQWYDPNHRGIWRYRIDKGKMTLDQNKDVSIDGNNSQDLIDCFRWGVEKYPAQNYMLILWSHGVGIIDPIWGKIRSIFSDAAIQVPPSHIDGVPIKGFDFISLLSTLVPEEKRGILFNEFSRTYMTNQELSKALKDIKEKIIKKKIDIVGMDACLMGMLEVGYQMKDYANYFISSEEAALATGWPYSSFLRNLSKGGFSAYDLSKDIIDHYRKMYNGRVSFYTQSAVDLQNISSLKDALDSVIINIREYKKRNARFVKQLVKDARSTCLYFSTPSYIDLYSFFDELLKGLNKNAKNNDMQFNRLKESIELVRKLLGEVVIANSTGSNYRNAGGLSIYYPTNRIDNSYQRTDFAKDSLWMEFLYEFGG